jgi:hypothetical protein
MAEVPESTAAAMTEATARSAETMTTSSAAEQPRLQLRRPFRLQLVQRYAAEAVSATTLYRRSGPGSTTISFSDMPFSCNFSDPCAFQQQLSAAQQQQQLVLQRPCVSVSGNTTRASSSTLGAASQHQ